MCYHLHKYDRWNTTTKSFDVIKNEIDSAILRGCNYMDITGGEPTIYPDIIRTIEYAKEKSLASCIITNGITSVDKIKNIIDSGLTDFLVSRHGLKETHNFITDYNYAYDKQVEFLDYIVRDIPIRFNCVITQFNQNDLPAIAREMSEYSPYVVNFINMNPHYEWGTKSSETQKVMANLKIVEPHLNEAISILEDKNIRVNVRYYPMCRIDKEYWRCIANDLHVVFELYDSFYQRDINCEWDYEIQPKNIEAHSAWGIRTSKNNEEKSEPCSGCSLQNICGGINKHYHRISKEIYGELCTPQDIAVPNDFYYFRKDNAL
jgi:MoaA/NifB/PqqE/SkfB family radical SAM enzyme